MDANLILQAKERNNCAGNKASHHASLRPNDLMTKKARRCWSETKDDCSTA